MVYGENGTSGRVGEGLFCEKEDQGKKRETPKGKTPSELKEEGGEVSGTVAKKLPPRVVVVAAEFVAAAEAAVVAALVAVVAAAVAVVAAAGVVFHCVEAGRE